MSTKKLKIIFAGTNEFALIHLKSLFFSHHEVIAIITKIDKKKISPIKNFALKKNIIIFQPKNLQKKKFYNNIKKIKADILIVCAYGMLIPKNIYNIFPKGTINIHASLLPRWRGAAPIQWSILSGDKNTGITVIKINSKIDTGKIIYCLSCPILKSDTTSTLSIKLIPISLQAMYQSLLIIQYQKPIIYFIQNKKKVTYAPKIEKKNTKISWIFSANYIDRLIRAFNPYPYSYFLLNNKIIKIIKASIIYINKKKYKIGEIIQANKKGIQINTKKNIINIKKIQISGGKPMHVSDMLNSKKKWFIPGKILT